MRIDRASRIIAAPRERIFQAFIDADAVLKWLPPAGARAVLEAFDPRPNGPFRLTLTFEKASRANGKTSVNSDTIDGKFVRLVRPELIDQQFTFVSDHSQFAGTMEMTWTFEEVPDGTLVTVAASKVPEGIKPEEHIAGMTSSLENLAAYTEPASA